MDSPGNLVETLQPTTSVATCALRQKQNRAKRPNAARERKGARPPKKSRTSATSVPPNHNTRNCAATTIVHWVESMRYRQESHQFRYFEDDSDSWYLYRSRLVEHLLESVRKLLQQLNEIQFVTFYADCLKLLYTEPSPSLHDGPSSVFYQSLVLDDRLGDPEEEFANASLHMELGKIQETRLHTEWKTMIDPFLTSVERHISGYDVRHYLHFYTGLVDAVLRLRDECLLM